MASFRPSDWFGSAMKISKTIWAGLLLGVVGLTIFTWVNGVGIRRLPFDAHSFRQCQTLTTAELYYEEGVDLLHPRTSYQGEPGVFVLEFPLFQALVAGVFHVFGESVTAMRAVNIFITLLSAGLVFGIARRWFAVPTAWLAALIYLTAPLNLNYMSSTLIDPFGVLLALAVFYLTARESESEKPGGWRVVGLVGLAILVALVKVLYLFPTLALLAVRFCLRGPARWRWAARWAGLLIPAAVATLLWNRHAGQVNNASFFTANIDPAAHLGFSMLLQPAWHILMAKRLFWKCLGPLGGLAAVAGWVWALALTVRTRRAADQLPWLVTLLAVAGYWLVFANINFPHEYYSLITLPFLALAAAGTLGRAADFFGGKEKGLLLSTGAGLVVMVASAGYFGARVGFDEEANVVLLREKAGDKLLRRSFAMVFIDPSRTPHLGSGHDRPEVLYALGLRGTAKVVANADEAVRLWRTHAPHYQHLRYAAFYGLLPPAEITAQFPRSVLADPADQIYVFAPAVGE
jgi:hypothetical protein